MKDLTTTYVHRGDASRRRRKAKRLIGIATIGTVAALILVVQPSPSAEVAQAAVLAHASSSAPLSETATLRSQLASTRGQLADVQNELNRATRIIEYAAKYDVSTTLTANVYDAAVDENIDPELAFRLVKLESDFNPRAVSSAGAVGLTQLMPSTARYFNKTLKDGQLFQAELNLHIGFRYLHSLMEQYGSVGTALLVYNRGEAAVRTARAEGRNPTNGYERILMKGYHGSGVIQ